MTSIHTSYAGVLDQLPPPFDGEKAQIGLERLAETAKRIDSPEVEEFLREVSKSSDGNRLLLSLFGNSPFLTRTAISDPEFLQFLIQNGADEAFANAIDPLESGEIEPVTIVIPSNTAKTLRLVKRRAALAIAMGDISGLWPQPKVVKAISRLAELSIQYAVRQLLRRAHDKEVLTVPNLENPETGSGYIVLGMGKLGARELNYSSDVDLIVFYDPETATTERPEKLQQNLVRLTRDLIQLLSERTEDGYVFRTDLRLRPDPSATPLAMSVEAAETYYESLGQNWERAAMIKARQVAGDTEAGSQLLTRLSPFVWRKNLDFATIQDIHAIKRQINAHRGSETISVEGHNVKLGRGGIREVEFFAQTQQLIWGGRHLELREPTTEGVLRNLTNGGHISEETGQELIEAYWYLRKVEHRIQMVDDQQTHELPADDHRLDHIATFLGHADVSEFRETLTIHLTNVETHYAQLFEEGRDADNTEAAGNLIFTGTDDDPDTLKTLTRFGFKDPAAIADLVRNWHRGHHRAMRTERARQILTDIAPALLRSFGASPDPDGALRRFNDFLGALPAGIQIFSLFRENPTLLELMAEVMGSAPRLASHLGRRPGLLDYVLEPEFYEQFPAFEALEAEIDALLETATNFESCLDQSRIWTGDRMLQLGIHALRQLSPWTDISASISDVAAAVISALANQVLAEFSRRHGHVPGGRWMVLGMGKLGGREMIPSSDLDLIIIYDHDENAPRSDGEKPLSPGQYFARLTQRLINALTAPTAEGNLYEVDMRLRPSGNAGPIASHIDAFTKYHAEASWTWEHMALARARPIYGQDSLKNRVTEVIENTLTRSRDTNDLLRDVSSMRDRIDKEHHTDSILEIKHYRGGLVDIEFLIQFLQLRHAADHPDVLAANAAKALDRLAGKSLIGLDQATTLRNALLIFQSIQGHLRLTLEGIEEGRAVSTLPCPLQEALARLGGCGAPDELENCLTELAAEVFTIYRDIL